LQGTSLAEHNRKQTRRVDLNNIEFWRILGNSFENHYVTVYTIFSSKYNEKESI